MYRIKKIIFQTGHSGLQYIQRFTRVCKISKGARFEEF